MFHSEKKRSRRYLSLYLPSWAEEIARIRSGSVSAEDSFKSLLKLGLKLLSFSPFVGLEKELIEAYRQRIALPRKHFGVILDISGTEKLYKKNSEPAEKILSKLISLKITARVGVAETIGAAWALSRFGKEEINFLDGALDPLKLFPIEAARLKAPIVEALHELGLYQIEQLLVLPRESLPIRFGEEILLRLDQIFGRVDEVLDLLTPTTPLKVSKIFAFALSREEQIVSALLSLIEELVSELRAQRKKASTYILKVSGYGENGERFRQTKEILLVTPIDELRGFNSIVRSVVESLNLPGAVEQITLVALDTEKALNQDEAILPCFDAEVPEEAIDQLINSLCMRLGNNNLRVIDFHQSYIPERSYSFKSIKKEDLSSPLSSVAVIRSERPSFILDRPSPIETISLLPDSPPAQIIWRGKKLKITKGIGPERISDEWWSEELSGDLNARDYFKIQDQIGRWLWVYREMKSNRWFLHGIWA